jgi:hypothetical protein
MSIRRALLPAVVAVAVSATAGSAETWICSHTDASNTGQTQFILSMNGGLLIEQPLGAVRYGVLQNDEVAVIAEDLSVRIGLVAARPWSVSL